MTTHQHPEWHGPHGESQLHVYNSLTSTKVPFVPKNGNKVSFYICGPTVYDSAHLGHARAYITFDILRRILEDYFKYDVSYVMNITDVDDKIILRARQNYLLKQYLGLATDMKVVAQDIQEAFTASLAKMVAKIANLEEEVKTAENRYLADMKEALAGEKLKLTNLQGEEKKYSATWTEIQASGSSDHKAVIEQLSGLGKSVLSAALDRAKGDTITDHSIFREHSSRFEAEFLNDMRVLGVRDADALTRVTEYVPNIVEFVKTIIANGFAYESKGSVYFDVIAFQNAGHDYGKLAPWCVGNMQLLNDGEGSLAGPSDKKSSGDFALWKASKPGEPFWDSPWGDGRPGWHIECSAMCSDVLGNNVDIHAGGEDLKFPHHDNELAQSEAHSGCNQWINHFWHAGHLNISGLKMSKSLKNFLTIHGVLEHYSPRQLRILFLLQKWDKGMTYSEKSLNEAKAKEGVLTHFFGTVKSVRRAERSLTAPEMWTDQDRSLNDELESSKQKVRAALCDNFDYPTAMTTIFDLIRVTNTMLDAKEGPQPRVLILCKIAKYVDSIMKVFGVKTDADFGFQEAGTGNSEEAIAKYMDAFAEFRAQVRSAAQEGKSLGSILQLCDAVRDDVMPELGIMLEDTNTAPGYIWKPGDRTQLIRERDAKRQQVLEKKMKKVKNQLKKAEQDLSKWQAAGAAPDQIHREGKGYSDFDEKGLPTMVDGKEASKKLIKKLAKATKKQEGVYKKLQDKLAQNPSFMEDLQTAVTNKQAELDAMQVQ